MCPLRTDGRRPAVHACVLAACAVAILAGCGAPTTSDAPPAPTAPASEPDDVNPNTLDPDRLFECRVGSDDATPARLWRLDGAEYEAATSALVDAPLLWNPLAGASSPYRFPNFASAQGMPSSTANAVMRAARDRADAWLADPAKRPACLDQRVDAACFSSVVDAVAPLLLRRAARADETARLVALMQSALAPLGPTGAARLGLSAMLSSPGFLFRDERGAGESDARGRRRLGSDELATALSYALTDDPPDATLRAAAAAGKLAAPAAILLETRRLLGLGGPDAHAGPGAGGPLLRFLQQYLLYPNAATVFKDPFLQVNQPALVLATDRALGTFLDGIDLPDFVGRLLDRPLGTDPQRRGVLMERSWLVAFSHAADNDPVRRGRFVSESLLCAAMPDVPIDFVPVPPPDDGQTTLRERLRVHTESARCRNCHERLEPIGLAFEGFDHTGMPRTAELGHPVDTTAVLLGAGEEDGPIADAADLTRRLARSRRVKQCVLRHALRFFLGRNEHLGDACTLAAMELAYDESGGRFTSALGALVTSDAFLSRVDPPAVTP